MKKNTKKTKSPDIIIDCVNFTTLNDLYNNYTYAKVCACKPITKEEFDNVIATEANKAGSIGFIAGALHAPCDWCKPKKQPWYKRFWNWLRRK